MKSLLICAALATTSMSGLNVHLVAVGSPHRPTCAEQLVGREIMGIGTVTLAEEQADHRGNFLVKLACPHGQAGANEVSMVLSQEQVCDFAASANQ